MKIAKITIIIKEDSFSCKVDYYEAKVTQKTFSIVSKYIEESDNKDPHIDYYTGRRRDKKTAFDVIVKMPQMTSSGLSAMSLSSFVSAENVETRKFNMIVDAAKICTESIDSHISHINRLESIRRNIYEKINDAGKKLTQQTSTTN